MKSCLATAAFSVGSYSYGGMSVRWSVADNTLVINQLLQGPGVVADGACAFVGRHGRAVPRRGNGVRVLEQHDYLHAAERPVTTLITAAEDSPKSGSRC